MKKLYASLAIFVVSAALPQQGSAKPASNRLFNDLDVRAAADDISDRISNECYFNSSAQLLPSDRDNTDDTYSQSHNLIEVTITVVEGLSATLSTWYGYDEIIPAQCKLQNTETWLLVQNRSL